MQIVPIMPAIWIILLLVLYSPNAVTICSCCTCTKRFSIIYCWFIDFFFDFSTDEAYNGCIYLMAFLYAFKASKLHCIAVAVHSCTQSTYVRKKSIVRVFPVLVAWRRMQPHEKIRHIFYTLHRTLLIFVGHNLYQEGGFKPNWYTFLLYGLNTLGITSCIYTLLWYDVSTGLNSIGYGAINIQVK